MASTFAFTVNGVSRLSAIQRGTLRWSRTFGKRATFGCQLFSSDGSWEPVVNQEVVWSQNGAPVFGGYIRDVTALGKMLKNNNSIFWNINCGDYSSLLEDRLVTETFPAGQTLKQWLTTLVTNWLTVKGISLDATQANGPTMTEAMQVDRMRADQVLAQFILRSEWLTKGLSATKTLKLFQSGSETAPFNVTSSNRVAIGDIDVQRLWNGQKYNRVIIKFGVAGVTEYKYSDAITVSGTPTSVTLNYTPVGWYPIVAAGAFGYGYLDSSVNGRDVVATDPSPFSQGYEYFPATNTIQKHNGAAFANGEVLTIPYDFRYPIEVIEESGSAATDPIELLVIDQSIRTKEEATLKAQKILAITDTDTERPHYKTVEDDLDIGDEQNINVPERDFIADCIITDIRARDTLVNPDPAGAAVEWKILYEVYATEGGQPKRTELDTALQWSLMGSGSGAVPGTAPNSSGGNTVPPFDTYVLFNDNMTMGAAAGLRWMKTLQETRFSHSSDHTKYARIRQVNATGDAEFESKGSQSLIAALDAFWTAGGFMGFDAVDGIQLDPGAVGATDAYNDLNKLTLLRSACGMFIDVSTSPFTIHTTSPSNTNEVLTYFCGSGSSAVNLPPLANLRVFPVTSVRRIFAIVNTKSSGDVTIDGDGSEGINGQSSITIGPGGAVLIGGHTTTQWRILAGFGAVGVGAGASASPPFTLLTADPSSPSDDTWWAVRTGTSPTMTVAVKARISGATQTIASITL